MANDVTDARPLPEGMVPFKPMTTPESRDALAKWMSLNAHDGSAYEGLMHLMVDRDLYETEVCRLSAELDRLRARLAEAEAEKAEAVAAKRELLTTLGQKIDDFGKKVLRIADERNEYKVGYEAAEARVKLLEEARPLAEWHEEDGPVLWWRFPVDEPPYVGSPLDLGRTYAVEMNIGDETVAGVVTLGGWPGYHTHWTPIVEPARAALAKEEGGR